MNIHYTDENNSSSPGVALRNFLISKVAKVNVQIFCLGWELKSGRVKNVHSFYARNVLKAMQIIFTMTVVLVIVIDFSEHSIIILSIIQFFN